MAGRKSVKKEKQVKRIIITTPSEAGNLGFFPRYERKLDPYMQPCMMLYVI
jgi:phosphate starvation-inducible protein PhoH